MHDDPTVALQPEDGSAKPLGDHPRRWCNLELIERVGAGGFGEVYRAWDPSLQRQVALKLLKPGTHPTDAAYQAILHEARALAKLRHPNIIPVFGVDQSDGRVGYWTDFVEGRTLGQILQTHGLLGAREAAGIGMEVAKALVAVHAAGLLHRDIKPQNIMREDGGRILLLDFGLSAPLDGTHAFAGTPAYMAPELFQGQPFSAASDIYALGVTLFVSVTGRLPADVQSFDSGLATAAFEKRRSLIETRPDLPDAFTAVVDRALHPDPKRRYTSAGQILAALSEATGPVAVPQKPRLGRVRILALGALLAAFLLVSAILVHRSRRPSANLDSMFLQAEQLLARYDDISNIDKSEAILRKILSTDPEYVLAQAALARAEFLRYRRSPDSKTLASARAAADRALALDPGNALANVTLAMIYTTGDQPALAERYVRKALSVNARNPDAIVAEADLLDSTGRRQEAEERYKNAVDLAPDDWRYPVQLGYFYYEHDRFADAAEQYKRATELTPGNSLAWNNLGSMYFKLENYTEAERALRHSIAVRPSFLAYYSLGAVMADSGRYHDAVTADLKAVELSPSEYAAWGNLASAYAWSGVEREKSQRAYRKAISLAEAARTGSPADPILLAHLASFYASVHDREHCLPLLRKAVALAPDNSEVQYSAAEASETLGERDNALDHIRKALRLGFPLRKVQHNPELRALCSDLRFRAIPQVRERPLG